MPLKKTIQGRPTPYPLIPFCCAMLVLLAAAAAMGAPCDIRNNAPAFIRHDLSESYCELCGYGYVTLLIANPYERVDMTDMTVVENLGASGLTFASAAPNAVTYSVNGGPAWPGGDPAVSGANGSILTFSAAQIPELARLEYRNGSGFNTLAITFAVTRAASLSPEGLVSASRQIEARLTYSTGDECFAGTRTVSSGVETLPLHEPRPDLSKRGRNVDAGQSSGQYSQTVYGNLNDDVVWRIRVGNSGLAGLQDLRFDDLMQSGNIDINYICPSEAAAAAIAANNGVGPGTGGCIAAGNSIDNFDVENPFGNPGNDSPDLVDVPRESYAYIYLVGKIPAAPNGSCSANRTNMVSDLQWGCQAQPPAGGIAATSTGYTPGNATATLSTLSVNSGNNLNIRTQIVGTNTAQPAGSKATVRITITNTTGGSLKGIRLRNVLPAEYVVDPTFTPAVAMNPAYGSAYPGMTDRIQWTNPAPGTFPLTTTDPAVALSNTAPEFRLYSSTTHPIYADQFDMLRHGDQLVITFRIVLIRPLSYDKTANLDVRVESPSSDPPGTDPSSTIQLTNRLFVDFQDFCEPGVIKHPPVNPLVTTHASNPEDLDINIAGSELVFILTGDQSQRLPLTVNLTNNGGHQAADYTTYITFGVTMDVVSAPAGCARTANPPPLSMWRQPAPVPPGAAVYQCSGAAIQPGQTVAYNFEVVKSTNPAALAADDLTFRGDVMGEITLSDGTRLWFPTPTARSDGVTDRANNYSLDGIRARVIGFNLLKSQVGTCTENNPPPALPDRLVQIGEECTFHVDTGGWFGFQTPGFTYIAVQDIQVFDEMPDGQGYVSSTNPYAASTSAIQGVSLNPAGLTALDEVFPPAWLNWTFNRVVPAQRITEKDHWFRVDLTSRLLNDPIDLSAAPNLHAASSINLLESFFQAVFFNDVAGREDIFNLGPSTVGYPRLEVRRIPLTVTEPRLTVVKEVCNESLYGTGPACSRFVPLASDGDAFNSYIYRLTVANESASSGIPRAPAYDVIVTDRLDASDLAYVLPFAGDGLDNDGDGADGGADGDGEGSISDNLVRNAVPAVITFAYMHSSALRRIDAGQSVRLYYRVNIDDDAAPLQTFTNTAAASYDSLEGVSGHQSAPQRPNSDKGGARVYTSPSASASVRIIPVETQPKHITRLANTPMAPAPAQPVSVGEEIEFEFDTLLPVALLRNFVIRDELPAGMSCAEAPTVNLNAPPYSAAGFVPGGVITPTCSGGLVEWNFGDQRVTNGTVGNRYDFAVRFIGRVENSAAVNDGDMIANGHPATVAYARYIDEAGSLITLNFGQVTLLVREPRLVLTKSLSVAQADAGDLLTVSVTATNTGTAPAYNLRVLDDLTGRNLSYAGSVGGANPPSTVDTTTLGANQPIFAWNPPNAIAPGATVSFTFQVRVDTTAQPQEVLDNTVQASWTSLPGRTTALNSSGSIGADGTVTGLRNGALPNAGHPVNDYEATASHAVTVPAPTLAKSDQDSAMIPSIGAHKPFRVEIRLPEGTTSNLVVTDSLNAAGVSYVLANNAAFDISYTFAGIASINGQAPGEAALLAIPADGASGAVVWDIGTVVTLTENDPSQNAISPFIRIEYFARVNNDLATDSGDSLRNSVGVNYRHGETGATQSLSAGTVAVTVVEPLLTVAKTVANVTPGKLPGDPAGGGDRLEYRVTVSNSGNATAFDLNLADTLSAGLALDSSFTPTAAIDGLAAAGFVAAPAGAPGGPLVWGRGNGDLSLDLPAGRTLLLTYRVVVQEASGELGNRVWVDWTSLNGASSYERTGAGCPTWTAPNDYCAGPAVTATNTADSTSLDKTILADSYEVPPLSTAGDAVLRVGDVVTYRLALNLRGGLTRDVRVQDLLPAGMGFVETVRINGDTTASYTPPASGAGSNFSYAPITTASVPVSGQTGTLIWTIGDIVNNPYGDPTTDTFEIVYRARVLPDAGLAQVASTALSNRATLTYVGAPLLNAAAALTVRQPVISQITKTDRSGRTSPAEVQVAADTMHFRLQACNSGQAPAYSAVVRDQLASQLDETSIANLAVAVGGAALNAGSDYLYTPPAGRGGTLQFALNVPLNPGQCLTIDYDIRMHVDFGSNQVWNNSASLTDYWSLPSAAGQHYGPVGPATFVMHNLAAAAPPQKTIVAPASGEATIGDEIVYRIAVPAAARNAAMASVIVNDTLDENLEFVSAAEVSGNTIALTVSQTPPNQVNFAIAQIMAGQQAVIELRARLRNSADANAGATFTNTALYTFVDPGDPAGAVQGGGSSTSPPVRIVEPQLAMGKAAANLTRPGLPPQAGDILRYILTFTAAGGAAGDNFSDAFDLRIDDSLGLGLAYSGNILVSGAGNTIGAPTITGDGMAAPQTLVWRLEAGNADIDVREGTQVSVSYEVRVLNSVMANQILSNSASAQWTGRNGASAYERNGTRTPAWNDYYTGPVTTTLATQDNTALGKTRQLDTWGAANADVRIGDIVLYELRLGLQEGSYAQVVVNDTLPAGLAFEGITSINGDSSAPYSAVAPFAHADIAAAAVSVTGDPLRGPTTVTLNLGAIVNQGDNNPANDAFVILYRARVLNDVHPQVQAIALVNNAALSYNTATGAATPRTGSQTITVRQPSLSVSKSAAPAGGDTSLAAGETVLFTVDIANTGTAPAYDTVLSDLIPLGLRGTGVSTVSMQLLSGPLLPNLAPDFNSGTGATVWDFDTGAADAYTIPAGDTLRIVYRVQADVGIGAGLTLANQAQVLRYWSFDDEAAPSHGNVTGVRQMYGPSNTAAVTLTTASPVAPLKQNPATTSAAVGVPFSYRVTVPAAPQPVALYDVRILDNLAATGADLSFVAVAKVAGSQPWNPVNTGSLTNLVIEDTTLGIDIPAGEQIVIEITVVLNDSPANVSGLSFSNTAAYTFASVNNTPASQAAGGSHTAPPMTVVGPDLLTLVKSGPASMQAGTPAAFTLDLHNPSTGAAWNPSLVDRLPHGATGGMCEAAPTNVSAQFFLADGVTPASAVLVAGTDFETSFTGQPDCEWRLRLLPHAGALAPGGRLIVRYDALLEPSTANGATLINVAGVTHWSNANPAAPGVTPRTYERVLTDGTPGTLDHQDAHTVTTQAPVLQFRKSVRNLTTGQNPGRNASPGDTLRYNLQIVNSGPVGMTSLTLVDEPDHLNAAPAFAPGSLILVSVPAGANTAGTSATGGTAGTGIVNVANLTLAAQGQPGESVTVEFDIRLAPVITSGTLVLNQARISSSVLNPLLSDDPGLGGDTDPTETRIASAPHFQVLKSAAVINGTGGAVMAGATLRYTLTVRNIGSENAQNVILRDNTPANTTYVAGSTRLNGAPVSDAGPGISPLQSGFLVNAPENGTAGFLAAHASPSAAGTAVVTFDVLVDATVMDGLVICNQGFVNGSGMGSGPSPEQPSDDPATAVPDDPTCVIVGSLPLLYALKTVAIQQDLGSPGIVDPGDVLRYTITISNTGAVRATNVVFTDAVPANTTYRADSARLNGAALGPDGGVSPLAAGLPVQSSDNPGAGIVSAGGSAVITFDVSVDPGVPTGTLISNQGRVASGEVPPDLTDADGLPANGRQPTVVVVGDVQLLSITKEVSVVGGGAAQPGSQLEYVVRVTNNGSLPATAVVLSDDLNPPLGSQVAYVDGSATMNGSTAGISYAGGILTADYAARYGSLAAGAGIVLRFRVQINAGLALGTTLTNTGTVRWSDPPQSASASVSIDVGGTPGSGTLNGSVWHDGDLDRQYDSNETRLENWSIELYRNNQLVASTLSDSSGAYRIGAVVPSQTGELYELRFRAPGAGPFTASLGYADSPFSNGPQRISGIVLASGANLQNMNLPIWPNGAVYNSVARQGITGARLTLLNAASGAALPASCFDDPLQQNQVTASGGFYKFDLNFSEAACPPGGAFLIAVTPPPAGYLAFPSLIIPPASEAATAPFSIPACPGSMDDAVPATLDYCEATAWPTVPPASVAPRTAGTRYYLHLLLDNGQIPGRSQVFNNPIPIDPLLDGAVALTKTAGLRNVTRGELVPYTITLTNLFGEPLYDISIVDRFPAGFKYVSGSARLDGRPAEPRTAGRELTWDALQLPVNAKYTLQLLLVVGSGVSEGEYVNRALAVNTALGSVLGEASATVRVTPDPTFDCTDVIGKVFDDRNLNGRQDAGEQGLAGVRVVSARGLIALTDPHGRFHFTCAAVPDEDRGSNFILKLDERSLPTGFRPTTENPLVQRATRGKMLRFNFGATVHRVVRMDVAEGAFEPDSARLRLQWQPRIGQLLEELQKGPCVLRLSYLADVEGEGVVRERLEALKKDIARQWDRQARGYRLDVETEIFWRRGAPPAGR